jgi:hypothetical protein
MKNYRINTIRSSNFYGVVLRNVFFIVLPLNILQCALNGHRDGSSTIEIKLVKPNFATMTNKQDTGQRIGYRFHEHAPISYGEVPFSNEIANIDLEKNSDLEKQFSRKESVFIYNYAIEENEQWVKQDWSFYMNPVKDGIEILLIVKPYNRGLTEFYGIQSCLRLGGITNSENRKEVANIPAFSEFDLWASDSTKPSLTYVQRKGNWESIPGTIKTLGARTPLGEISDYLRTKGKLETEVGPYNAKMLEPIDNGLIIRTNISDTWVCGIVWEQTSHVSDHHPADCLHSIINIGNIPPYSKKAIRGKIYWFKGTKAELLNHYQADFVGNKIDGGYYWGVYK